ncbi:MAG: LssY C-terminal domain-containing protein [bacterium]|nr:hypothetical protein [Gammaproteobacteria bacterium]HIL98160.1 hypothetical protein [Pseudomonadales bacterium]
MVVARPDHGTFAKVVSKLLSVTLALLVCGCTSGWAPLSIDEVPFRDRAETQDMGGVRVTASVPSARESHEIFADDLYKRGVQPVWLEIENRQDEAIVFLSVGLDANYFTPHETASLFEKKKFRRKKEVYFFSNGVESTIQPGETRSGFVFSHLDEGTKAFNVDIAGEFESWHLTIFIQVPGLKVDHYDVDFRKLYSLDQVESVDESSLVTVIEALPCCTRDKKGESEGDPLNLVVVGAPMDVYYAFIRAGWDETEVVAASSGFKTAISFITGGEYRYSPVSSLYVFIRPQDVAFQRIRTHIHERNHLRLWMSRWLYEGNPVWIGQISRDIGVRFTTKTITTHKIDPNVDETREFLVENLAYNQVLARLGYADGAVAASIQAPRRNLTGDRYFTDGRRVVLWVTKDQVELDDIEIVEWKTPLD